MGFFWTALAALLLFVVLAYVWMFRTLAWIGHQTQYDAFFKLSLADRIALRKRIQAKARLMRILVTPLVKLGVRAPETEFEGTTVPGICPSVTMDYARHYQPESNDIFVATQMKCGTTWMQQIVFQLLTRGDGEFSDDGYRHMYAISPWIESVGAVRLADAPLIEGRRIIKTHLGTELCPYSNDAKYIYVLRHPAACLASAVDFVDKLLGPMAPQAGDYESWFCSEGMWWGPWADHADGWWRWSTERDNVHFVHYETLLAEPEAEIAKIAEFLAVDLSEDQLASVVDKSGYQYMKDNDHFFEMSAPTPMDVGDANFFVKGSSNRGDDVSEEARQRVLRYCADRLKDAAYPVARFYPDVH